MSEKKLPNFFLIGPPKTATTSLHYYLSQHPEVCMSEPKETRYLDNNYKENLAGYDSFFAHYKNEKAIADASPTYAFLPFVADRIKKHFPQAKIIFCFRDPVDRAFSGWLMRCAKGNEKNNFIDALKLNLEQRKSINFEGEAGLKEWLKDQSALGGKNQIVYRTYIEGSMYSEQLKSYMQRFPKEQIQIIWLDDLKKDFMGTLKNVFAFIGVAENFSDIKTEAINKHKKVRLKGLFNLFGKDKVKNVKKYLPGFMQKLLKPILRTEVVKPEMTIEEKQFAYKIFASDIEELERLTGRDLSKWKNKYINI